VISILMLGFENWISGVEFRISCSRCACCLPDSLRVGESLIVEVSKTIRSLEIWVAFWG
jgi:hypothetical protein